MSRARERAIYLPALLSAGGGGSVQKMKAFRGWVTVMGWMELTR